MGFNHEGTKTRSSLEMAPSCLRAFVPSFLRFFVVN